MTAPPFGLNQRNFSANLQEILKHLDHFFISQNAAGSAYTNKDTLSNHVDSVMFNFKPKRYSSTKLSSLHELELVNELSNYFSRQKTEYVRYCVFDLIFTMKRSSAKEYRRQILVLLTSLAIALKSVAVLECVALWFATTEREHSLHVASSLANDFCCMMPESSLEVKACEGTCEKFCSMLMTAFCANYTMKDPNSEELSKKVEYPPIILLDLVQHWLLKNPEICFCVITKLDQLWHTVLTTTRTASNSLPLSPLAGLIQWSVKLPFSPDDIDSQLIKQYENLISTSYNLLQSKLHFGVLTAMLAAKDCLDVIKQGIFGPESEMHLWSKSDAHTLVGGLLAYGADSPDPKTLTLAVERFSQVSQVALTCHVLNCTKEQFQSLTDPLPKTRLLELVAYGPDRKPPIDDIPM